VSLIYGERLNGADASMTKSTFFAIIGISLTLLTVGYCLISERLKDMLSDIGMLIDTR
tara:strand:- start:1075 stop:1248 length:174 start_codon:yes stop_codon:yes gene_type:complete